MFRGIEKEGYGGSSGCESRAEGLERMGDRKRCSTKTLEAASRFVDPHDLRTLIENHPDRSIDGPLT